MLDREDQWWFSLCSDADSLPLDLNHVFETHLSIAKGFLLNYYSHNVFPCAAYYQLASVSVTWWLTLFVQLCALQGFRSCICTCLRSAERSLVATNSGRSVTKLAHNIEHLRWNNISISRCMSMLHHSRCVHIYALMLLVFKEFPGFKMKNNFKNSQGWVQTFYLKFFHLLDRSNQLFGLFLNDYVDT